MKLSEITFIRHEKNIKTWHVAFLMLLLAFVGYGVALKNYFFLDDTSAPYAGYILSREPLRLFTENFDVIYMSRLWRLVVSLSYVPNYLLSGLDPWSYYLVNILLHAGCGILTYLITLQLTKRKRIALLTAVLGAMTMIKADAVFMIAHRTTLLGAFFSLASFLAYTRLLTTDWEWKDAILCVSAYLLGIFSYETTLMLPAVFLGTAVILYGRTIFQRKYQLFLALALLVTSGALIICLGMIGNSSTGDAHGVLLRIWHILRNILAVVPIFVIPPFLLHYDNSYHSVPITYGWIEMVGTGLLFLLTWFGFRLKDKPVLIGVLFFVIMAVPTAQVHWYYYPDITSGLGYMNLRWSVGKFSYLSSFGIYMASGILISRLYAYLMERVGGVISVRWCAGLLLVCYIIFNGYWLFKRERTWQFVTSIGRTQVEALKALHLPISPETNVFVSHLAYYHHHAQALLRVLYKAPQLKVRDARDWQPGGPSNNLFIIENGSFFSPRLSVFRIGPNGPENILK